MKKGIFISALAALAVLCSCQTGPQDGKTAKKDIAVQLYSVRSLIGAFGNNSSDYKPLLDTLAKMGYTAVEAASYADGKLYGADPAQFNGTVQGRCRGCRTGGAFFALQQISL